MYSREHGAIALYVISPALGEEEAEEATAIVPEVFHDQAGDKDYRVTIPGRIGSVALHEGNVVHGTGNKAAHNAAELILHDLYCDPEDTWLSEEQGGDRT